MPAVEERTRAQAERTLDREYAALRPETLRALRTKLALRGLTFDETDLEAFYNQAWHGLYVRLADGETIENRAGFLVQAAFFRAIDEARSTHPGRRAEGIEPGTIGREDEVDERLDDHTRLTQFMEGMRERLQRIGGALRIRPGEARGTVLVFDLPMDRLP